MDQAKRMKQLEKENAKLKKLLAEAELDKAMLAVDRFVSALPRGV